VAGLKILLGARARQTIFLRGDRKAAHANDASSIIGSTTMPSLMV
jgi:hypothetical protein